MMTITKLRTAISILSAHDDFNEISFIAELRWKKIPEAYKYAKAMITNGNKITVYVLDGKSIVDIMGLGFFQIT
jgi:hypothetical protein